MTRMRSLLLASVLVLLASGAARAENDPFSDGAISIRHEGAKRFLVYTARNTTGKDVKSCEVAYVLRSDSGHVVESDVLTCADPSGGPLFANGYAGVMCSIPIREETVASGSFGFQTVTFTDGTVWKAPIAPAPHP